MVANYETDFVLAAHRNAVEHIPVGRYGPIQKNRMELAEFLRAAVQVAVPLKDTVARHKLLALADALDTLL